MKMRKFMIASTAFIMILGLLVVVPVQAQVTFDSWVCKWFKGGEKNKGVLVDPNGTLKAVEKLPVYATVQSWDQGSKTFTSILIQQEDGAWMPIPFVALVLNDNPLDYVSYALLSPGGDPSGMIEALLVTLSVQGKAKGNDLVKGKVQTVGGSVIYNDLDNLGLNYFVTSESLKMKMIPFDKVPDDVIADCGAFCAPCAPPPGP